jgi:hypothetical protein
MPDPRVLDWGSVAADPKSNGRTEKTPHRCASDIAHKDAYSLGIGLPNGPGAAWWFTGYCEFIDHPGGAFARSVGFST